MMNFSLIPDLVLAFAALHTAHRIYKDHRAPAVGMLLISLSLIRADLEWACLLLGPALVSFGFLWLSEDRLTAHVLLMCSVLLPFLHDCVSSQTTIMVLSRCVMLSSLTCLLVVSLFTGSACGALGGVTLCLPTLMGCAQVMMCKGSLVVGCVLIRRALDSYMLVLNEEFTGAHLFI